ncbi:MAG TPA: ATP-dependent zinc metalloprotease FtsH [Chthoniobacterales bacterium]|nr:ATP-dependent zinc metalloprotease FtsH [Chthoniobacterales bacterium]
MPAPEPDDKRSKLSKTPQVDWRWAILHVLLAIWMVWGWQQVFSHGMVRTIPYSEFKERLAKREVKAAQVGTDEITGRIEPATTQTTPQGASPAPDPKPFIFRTVRVEDPNLVQQLQDAGVAYAGEKPSFLSQFLTAWLIPLGIMALFWFGLSRMAGTTGRAIMGIGKSRARLIIDEKTGVSFADVAGVDEAKYELQEVVDFLKNPQRYQSLGAKIPKGVLLVGPPGTGKTLLARAVAGEAGVPFFSLSGSDFVEMFVGVGAARVRDLFQQAKQKAPCIIFIDELDAIGRQRGVHVAMGHDEREQTLNALLVEMDGFDPNAGVILLGATNRPEVLDRALLRPGRFDRQVIVDAPDIDGREAILKVHARNKRLAEDVNLREIAQATPGFSGADLANTLNEAALLAARRQANAIHQQDLREALEKVIAGPERKSRRLNEEEKRRVAYHEVGHALVAAYSEHADPVRKISIVPRGRAALGYTMQLPTQQQFLMSRPEILDRICGLLGGRAAEEIIFGEVTTGAENDLERATAMARQMVGVYGMSEQLGLARLLQREGSPFLAGADGAAFQRDCSEETAQAIDAEVKSILDSAYAEAKRILSEQRDQLESVTRELLKCETIEGEAFYQIIGRSAESVSGQSKLRVAAAT